MSILDKLVQVRKITTKEEFELASKAASSDEHLMVNPNVAFWKGGEIIGCASLFNIPIVSYWLDSDQGPKESLQAISQCEAILSGGLGVNYFFAATGDDSPYKRALEEHLGYKSLGHLNMYSKNLIPSPVQPRDNGQLRLNLETVRR